MYVTKTETGTLRSLASVTSSPATLQACMTVLRYVSLVPK